MKSAIAVKCGRLSAERAMDDPPRSPAPRRASRYWRFDWLVGTSLFFHGRWNPADLTLSRIDLLAADPGPHLLRLDLRLRLAIRDGVVAVYLGNDTHWGSTGHEIVARELVADSTGAGVIVPARRQQRGWGFRLGAHVPVA